MAGLAGSFAKGLVDAGASISKAVSTSGVNPAEVLKILGAALPVVGAMQLLDLSPTGGVVGEYIKNKLVPGLEEANKAREMELAAKMEMGSRYLPEISAGELAMQQGRASRELAVQSAMMKKDEILGELARDEFLKDVDISRLSKLVDDVIRIAPFVTVETPSVVLSVIRDAALSGMDSIGVGLATQLATVEREYSGRRG